MKNHKIFSNFAPIINRLHGNDLQNARVNSCNLFAEFINDYTSDGIEVELTEFFESSNLSNEEKRSFVESPDLIMTSAFSEFLQAVANSFFQRDIEKADEFIRKAKLTFSGYSETFYFFAYPWSNCCFDAFIFRDTESEALEALREKFENDENPEGLENLVFLGSIDFEKATS